MIAFRASLNWEARRRRGGHDEGQRGDGTRVELLWRRAHGARASGLRRRRHWVPRVLPVQSVLRGGAEWSVDRAAGLGKGRREEGRRPLGRSAVEPTAAIGRGASDLLLREAREDVQVLLRGVEQRKKLGRMHALTDGAVVVPARPGGRGAGGVGGSGRTHACVRRATTGRRGGGRRGSIHAAHCACTRAGRRESAGHQRCDDVRHHPAHRIASTS